MSDEADDWDADDETEHLEQVKDRLRTKRGELARTIRALRAHRRTPAQIRAVIDRSKRLIYKSILLRRKIGPLFRVH